jgi:predicted DNA-binding transcriptional regulator AlpA
MSMNENLLADFLSQEEAAGELKVCERTLDRWRRLNEGPPTTKLGRRVLYRRSSLQAWLCAREYQGSDGDTGSIRSAQSSHRRSGRARP